MTGIETAALFGFLGAITVALVLLLDKVEQIKNEVVNCPTKKGGEHD